MDGQMDGRKHGWMQGWMDGWGIVLILEEVSQAGFPSRAGQETGGEAICPGCTGSYRLHRAVCLVEIGNTFVSICPQELRAGAGWWLEGLWAWV